MRHKDVRLIVSSLVFWTACVDDSAPPSGMTAVMTAGSDSTTELPPGTSSTGDVAPTTTSPATTTTTITDGTTSEVEPPGPLCGDGSLDPGEDCDLGADNSNDGACTLQCHPNVCGDGLVWLDQEACDFGPGNVGSYGGCNPDCTLAARCGDGDVDLGFEECDLAGLNGTGMSLGDDGACAGGCTWVGRIVFVTSQSYTGALGGLPGADLQCVQAATDAGVANPTTFRAWLSDGTESPSTRFEQVALLGAPYLLLNGRVLAEDFQELADLGPRTGIAVTEAGEPVFEQFVWTNTGPFGEVFDAMNHCGQWTSASALMSSRTGLNALLTEAGPTWDTWRDDRQYTSAASYNCGTMRRLYCFEDGYVDEGDG